MIYILAVLVPPLGLLLNGQPFSALFNLILIVPCIIFGLVFHVLLLVPSIRSNGMARRPAGGPDSRRRPVPSATPWSPIRRGIASQA
jgi:hypothetical protein